MKDFDGALGKYHFDENGDVVGFGFMNVIIQNGEKVPYNQSPHFCFKTLCASIFPMGIAVQIAIVLAFLMIWIDVAVDGITRALSLLF